MSQLKGVVIGSKSIGELVRKIKKSDPHIFKKGVEKIIVNHGSEVYYPKKDCPRIPLMQGDVVSFVLKRPLSTGIGFFSDEP